MRIPALRRAGWSGPFLRTKIAKAAVDPRERAADLAFRATLLRDQEDIENLQRIYGYYLDRNLWSEIAALFAPNGTIEMGLGGVYAGTAASASSSV